LINIAHSLTSSLLDPQEEIILLITNGELTQSEEYIIKNHIAFGKPSIVGVAVHDNDSSLFQSQAVKKLEGRLREFKTNSNVPVVYPVRTLDETVVNCDGIETVVHDMIYNKDDVLIRDQQANKLFETKKAYSILVDFKSSLDLMDGKLIEVEGNCFNMRDMIKKDFVNEVIPVVKNCVAELSGEIRTHCDNISLVLNGHRIANDLKEILKRDYMSKAKLKV
jgi:hypothetical protein